MSLELPLFDSNHNDVDEREKHKNAEREQIDEHRGVNETNHRNSDRWQKQKNSNHRTAGHIEWTIGIGLVELF